MNLKRYIIAISTVQALKKKTLDNSIIGIQKLRKKKLESKERDREELVNNNFLIH
jgi:hypothetical protein